MGAQALATLSLVAALLDQTATLNREALVLLKHRVEQHAQTIGVRVIWDDRRAKNFVLLKHDVSAFCGPAPGCVIRGNPSAYVRRDLTPDVLARLIAHELGHLAGLEHSGDGIMAAKQH